MSITNGSAPKERERVLRPRSKRVGRAEREVRKRSHPFWVGFLAGALARIARANNLQDVKQEARESLEALTDPMDGLDDLDDNLRRPWRTVALEEDHDE